MKKIVSILAATLAMAAAKEKPNVLLICVDDLRPELGCYGKDYIHSPHIDRLARRGVTFENHYVQAPTCGASRYAMLTGHYGSEGNQAIFQRAALLGKEEVKPSLPAYFRNHGYTTVSVGKVSHHPGGMGGKDWDDATKLEMPESWDRHLLPAGPWQHPRGWMHGLANGEIRTDSAEMDVFQATKGDDSIYPDGVMIPAAIEQLQDLAKEEEPFFLAVGILRPHLPFGAPKKYLDLYAKTKLPPIPHPEKPEGLSTWHASGEFMRYNRWGKNPNEDSEFADEVRLHYAACVSYADTMVGKVLAALDESGARDNTIVVLWGDHGWHLGEHAVWGKHSLFEESLRAPLMIVAPEQKTSNQTVSAIVQSVDIYPTLCELAGLSVPSDLDGRSLQPLLENPDGESRGFAYASFSKKETLRTKGYRFIAHQNGLSEVYDLESDPGEEHNIADRSPDIIKKMRAQIAAEVPAKER